MTLAECRSLNKGDKILVSLGNGWYQEASYIKLVEVTKFPTMTFADLMKGNFDLSNGKKATEAEYSYKDDRGRERVASCNPRRLRKA